MLMENRLKSLIASALQFSAGKIGISLQVETDAGNISFSDVQNLSAG